MNSPRSHLVDLVEQGIVPPDSIEAALHVLHLVPDGASWRNFLDRLLLWLGGIALAASLLFFIAYNWSELGRLAKFAMVEGAIVVAIAAYCRFSDHTAAGQAALFAATIGLGILLALHGQTYQTGADPWQLFFTWSLLMLPWALIGRFAGIWLFSVLLLNITIVLYHLSRPGIFWFMTGSDEAMLWLLFLFNTLVLAVWELSARALSWLDRRWAVRLLTVGSGTPLTLLVLLAIFDNGHQNLAAALVWAGWLVLIYYTYRSLRPDLFMLACCCLSAITVCVSFAGKHLLASDSAGGFLIVSLLVVVLGTGAALWLKRIHLELEA